MSDLTVLVLAYQSGESHSIHDIVLKNLLSPIKKKQKTKTKGNDNFPFRMDAFANGELHSIGKKRSLSNSVSEKPKWFQRFNFVRSNLVDRISSVDLMFFSPSK